MTLVTTTNSPDSFHPNEVALAPEVAIPQSLILQCTTVIGTVTGDDRFTVCPFVSTEGQPAYVKEGDELAEANPNKSEITIMSGKVGYFERVSREQLMDPVAGKILNDDMNRSLANRANGVFINQPAPTSPAVWPPAGLLARGTHGTDPVEDNLDLVSLAIAEVQSLPGGDDADLRILVDPIGWANLNIQKKSTGSNESLLGSGAEATERRLKGVQVIVTSSMPILTMAVLDRRRVLSAVGPVLAATSEHAEFTSENIVARMSIRFGIEVNDARAVQVLPVAPRAVTP
ncbi:phage major capsid protein [Mycobacteroides abscessus]